MTILVRVIEVARLAVLYKSLATKIVALYICAARSSCLTTVTELCRSLGIF